MEAIKQLGTNGGGFFNINSATTLREPDRPHQLLSIFLLLGIPFSLTYVFGKMVGQHPPGRGRAGRHGHHLRGLGRVAPPYYEHQTNPAVQAAGAGPPADGNTTGKEVRFG